jgi:aryl-alcohol dehydrogenase-like predicted oxidoreductase
VDDKPIGTSGDGSTLLDPSPDAGLPLPPSLTRRPIGRTSIEPTILTLGTWGLGDAAYGPNAPDALETMVRAAVEQGIRSFDVAPLWGDGRTEEVVGALIRDRRDEFTVITRAGAIRKGHSVVRMFDPAALEASIGLSRKRLGIETLDAVLLHDPPEKIVAQGAFAKALAGLAARGWIKSWGVSTASVDCARLAMGFGAKTVCIPHHVLAPDVLAAIVDDADGFGAGIVVRSPLAHGLLTDAGSTRPAYSDDDHRSRRWSASALTARQKQAAGLAAVWTQKAPSLTAFALRFALSSPHVASAIIGPRTPEQLRELVAAVHDSNRLDAVLLERTSQVSAVLGV